MQASTANEFELKEQDSRQNSGRGTALYLTVATSPIRPNESANQSVDIKTPANGRW